MHIDSIYDKRDPGNWQFGPHNHLRDWALKKLIQVIAFDNLDALEDLRKEFDMLDDKRPRCPECHRRGCEPWNHDYERNAKRAVCTVCYEQGCMAKKHANE